MVFVATSRTSVVVFEVLVVVFGMQRLTWRGTVALVLASNILLAIVWASPSYLRSRVVGVAEEVQQYEAEQATTSSGYRLEFWKKSVSIFIQSPIIGHGTGSTMEMFRRVRVGETGLWRSSRPILTASSC